MRHVLSLFLIFTVIIGLTFIIIVFGRGYRLDLGQKKVVSTGLLVASSDPSGAQVFIDNQLKSATNTTLTLPPGWYQIKLVKEGFASWEKKIKIQGEIVAETNAFLFPLAPSLSPLTHSGVAAPTLSPDGTKVVYAVPKNSAKAGLWLLNLSFSPLGFRQEPELLTKMTTIDFSAGSFIWSPDSKQIVAVVGENRFLIDLDKKLPPSLLLQKEWETLNKTWQEEEKIRQEDKLSVFPKEFIKIASESAKIISFSPDEKKVLYQANAKTSLPKLIIPDLPSANPTPEKRDLETGKIYVYDLSEDKNFEVASSLSTVLSLSWFPTSRHLIEVTSDKISFIEYDGTNKGIIYNGPFSKYIAAVSNGKILISTNLNQEGDNLPNLYFINLR